MCGIEFEVVWFDQDVVEYQVTCSNGRFCGMAKMYSAHDDLSKIADTLSGFPFNVKDSRNVRLGTLEPNYAGGGIDMSFSCIDSSGHAFVLVKLRADGCKAVGDPESVCLDIPIEAASVDAFVAQARSIQSKKGSKASLLMADFARRS